jgi:hypothetical protein
VLIDTVRKTFEAGPLIPSPAYVHPCVSREPPAVWCHLGEQSMHRVGYIGVHGALPAAGEIRAGSADLGAAAETL